MLAHSAREASRYEESWRFSSDLQCRQHVEERHQEKFLIMRPQETLKFVPIDWLVERQQDACLAQDR